MGNRAVIATAPYDDNNVGIYIHWNGGYSSVAGFLDACKRLGFRSPGQDSSYGMARLVQVIGTFFDDGLSVGIGTCGELRGGLDNGVYLIDGDWQIVGREDYSGPEELNPEKRHAIADMLVDKLKQQNKEAA